MNKLVNSIRIMPPFVAELAIEPSKRLFNRIRSKFRIDIPLKKYKLLPLYPEKNTAEHKVYVDALNEAIKDKYINNIALTGSYGSGKSSILKDFTSDKEDRTVCISFATYGFDKSTTTEQDSKSTPEEDLARVQKEIVKQLLYRERYSKVPSSRYPRIFSANFPVALTRALIVTVLFPVLLFVLGKIDILKVQTPRAAIAVDLVFLASFYVFYLSGKVLKNLRLDKVTGGSGPISASLTTSNNYFDQHLDEIIYFFEVSGRDIVILEDLDRLDDFFIFENLRQLNILLNSSLQVGRNIKFIYAVRDSIFNENNNSGDGNRTKFFELIIPTVPFITHKNSRDLLTRLFKSSAEIDRSLIALISKHTADMRLIKNIYNEYVIFYQKIIVEGKIPGLLPTNLFAMIVYKNTYLSDFEKIRLGTSMIDQVYAASKKFVEDFVTNTTEKIAAINRRIVAYDSVPERSTRYGLQLTSHLHKLLDTRSAFLVSVELNGVTYTETSDLESRELWEAISAADTDAELTISYRLKAYPNPTVNTFTEPLSSIKAVIGDELNENIWRTQDTKPLIAERRKYQQQIKTILNKSIKEMIEEHEELREIIIGVADEGLLYELFEKGYIDANYILYASVYREENVSAHGMGFIIRAVYESQKELYYKFNSDAEIESVLSEIEPAYLNSRSIYNIDILNYFLKNSDNRMGGVIDLLVENTDEDIELIDKIIETKGAVKQLVTALSPKWDNIFDYIFSSSLLDQKNKLELIDVAITFSDPKRTYLVDERGGEFLAANAQRLKGVQAGNNPEYAARFINLLMCSSAQLASLNRVTDEALLKEITDNRLYALNTANLRKLVGSSKISLSEIKNANSAVFERVCEELPVYLELVRQAGEKALTIDSKEDFVAILNRISGQPIELVQEVISRSSEGCVVEDIQELDSKIWKLAFSSQKVANNYANVLAYFTNQGEVIDEALIAYLNDVKVMTDAPFDEAQTPEELEIKKKFSLAILESTINPEAKATATDSLNLKTYIGVAEFSVQNGTLYGYLLEHDVINDTADSFIAIAATDWDTKAAYIASSTKFIEYIGDLELTNDEIAGIFSSVNIGADIKKYILDNLSRYEAELSISTDQVIVKYVIESGISLNAPTLLYLVREISGNDGLELMFRNMQVLDKANMLLALSSLGGEYAKLAQPNKRPSFSYDANNLKLAERLQELGIISSSRKTSWAGKLQMVVKTYL